MTRDQHEIRRKLRVLEYADKIGDVSKTCRYFGIGRASFYRWRKKYADKPDPATHRCPDNGARVNVSDCSISADAGASELKTLWHDPDFNPTQRAFYYIRVLENPTCRWSTWDAVSAGTPPNPGLPAILQERAWSSPIWLNPETP